MARRLLAVLAIALLVPVSPALVQADPMLYTCIGAPASEPAGGQYPERRQFVESQGWWVPGRGQAVTPDSNHGHVHAGACIPERETLNAAVTPNVSFNVRVMLHNNPTTSTNAGSFYAALVFKGTNYETTVQKQSLVGLAPCAGTCEKWVNFTQPLSRFNQAGLQEIRIRTFVPEPKRADGTSVRQNTSLNWQTTVHNGKTVANVSRFPWLRAKGWYTHALYCESAYLSVPLPDGPVSGTWRPRLQLVTHDSDASLPVTHFGVRIDPNFHTVPPVQGTVLHDADGQLPPTTLAIDTTHLANGTHRLHLRADCRDNTFASTNSGVLIVPFRVQN
jgi:hypothetical protein